ncbi:hypothetical protein [Sphaerothrix gracilis]
MAQCLSPDQVAQDALRSLDQQQFTDSPGLEMALLAHWHGLIIPML